MNIIIQIYLAGQSSKKLLKVKQYFTFNQAFYIIRIFNSY